MNSKRKGAIAIGEAIQYFSSIGASVFAPVTDCEKYDLIIDEVGKLYKIEVKYAGKLRANGSFSLDLRTYGGYRDKVYDNDYKDGDFDFLFIYCPIVDKRYLMPAKEVIGKHTITVGNKKWSEYEV